MHNIIVADTSVLIALEKLNIFDSICNIYEKVLIPQAVLKEYGSQLNECFEVRKINDIRLLEIVKELNLGKGESEAIVIAFENDFPVLIDDLKARNIAKKLHLTVSVQLEY